MHKLKRFFKISSKERKAFFEALLLLYYCRILLIFTPFRKVISRFEPTQNEGPIKDLDLYIVKKSILRANYLTFWKNKCLASTLCARRMLNKRAINSEAHLSIKKDNTATLAHAWIQAENVQIVEQNEGFTDVLTF